MIFIIYVVEIPEKARGILMILIVLLILMALFWVGFKLTGAILGMFIWICFRLPIGLFLICLGIMLCCTIILIPVGKSVCGFGWDLIFP